ncbi:MAG TPA: NADH-quinone oxidoreductase subunit L, partial [Burkholderiales bacterium]|nr:NADH-quinone oxidoreductase subunit L [Burkholderiales bacterium]
GYLVGYMVFGDYFGDSLPPPDPNYYGIWEFIKHGFTALPFWLALAGIATAAYLYLVRTDLPARVARFFGPVYALVEKKYGFDELYSWLLAGGARNLGKGFWRGGDQTVIDGLMVNGSARVVGWFSGVVRLAQTGLLNTYAFLILFGILTGLTWMVWRYWTFVK